jgi:4-hydroxybenzoate polyprenyltransferase
MKKPLAILGILNTKAQEIVGCFAFGAAMLYYLGDTAVWIMGTVAFCGIIYNFRCR